MLKEAAAALLVWASQASGLAIPPGVDPPKVEIVDELPNHWAGATFVGSGTVQILKDYQNDRCVWEHEFTHWLQWANHQPMMETPAYNVTAKCYRALGENHNAVWAEQQAEKWANQKLKP